MTDAKGLSLTPVDGRTVRLHKPTEYREEVKGSDIIRLYQDNGPLEIKVGSSITYGKTKHKVNVIKRGMHGDKIACYDLKNSLLTSSSIFALPFLGGNKKYMLWDSLFVNAFISTEEYDECIALLYRFSGETLFTKFEPQCVLCLILSNLKTWTSTMSFSSLMSQTLQRTLTNVLGTENTRKLMTYGSS